MNTPGKALAPAERIFLFSTAYTFNEYVGTVASYRSLLRIRLQEVRLKPDAQGYFALYPDMVHMLVIAAEDSPDTVAVLPILERVVMASPRIDLRILHDEDENWNRLAEVVGDQEMFDGLSDIDPPLLVLLDSDWQFLDYWGPHPESADGLLDEWLERYPEYEALAEDESSEGQETYNQLLDKLVYDMRVWYNSGLNDDCVTEIRQLLDGVQEDDSDDEDDED